MSERSLKEVVVRKCALEDVRLSAVQLMRTLLREGGRLALEKEEGELEWVDEREADAWILRERMALRKSIWGSEFHWESFILDKTHK